MKDISVIITDVNKRMDELEKLREISVSSSRTIIRMTKKIIHSIHLNEDHLPLLKEAVAEYDKLYSLIRDEPEILFSGAVADMMTEFAEACILSSVVMKKDIPSYDSMKITPQSWVLGIADCLGELRRVLLNHLINNDIIKAKDVFNDMEIICDSVLSFDVPDAILPVRRKQDIARSVMERTRTDIANALLMSRNVKNV
ncbi:MAG: RNA-binding protein [Methanomassiliicoccaceae archaeon]|nr:RNA-binding protein [Methanomassiliicoccaceae archaeon]